MRILALGLASLLFIAAPVQADSYRDKVVQILSLTQQDKAFKPMLQSMLSSLRPMMQQNIVLSTRESGQEVDEERLTQLLDHWSVLFLDNFETGLTDAVSETYKRFYTEDDLDALIVVLKSPAFQKFASHTQELTAALMQVGGTLGEQMATKAMEEALQKYPLDGATP